MKRLVVTLAAALLVCFPKLAIAEPSATVSWLMSEPVTLFDRGLHELQAALDGTLSLPNKQKLGAVVHYNWKKNRVHIRASASKARDIAEAREWCRAAVGLFRNRLGVDPKTGALHYPVMKHSLVEVYFAHTWFRSKSRPNEIASELDNIIELSATIFVKEGVRSVSCQGPLLSSKVLFEE